VANLDDATMDRLELSVQATLVQEISYLRSQVLALQHRLVREKADAWNAALDKAIDAAQNFNDAGVAIAVLAKLKQKP
jgi:hypothetical protein